MNTVLFDTLKARRSFSPLSLTRPLCKIRIGIATIEEKWAHHLPGKYSSFSEAYLEEKFPYTEAKDNLLINSTILPNTSLASAIQQLQLNEKLISNNTVIAVRCDNLHMLHRLTNNEPLPPLFKEVIFTDQFLHIHHKWDIFSFHGHELLEDWKWICQPRKSFPICDDHTIVYNKENVFLEKGVSTKASVLNAEEGPIYLGKNVKIGEGAVIRGPVAICTGAQINALASIRNSTTIGPYVKVGGEVANTVFIGYSNKAHTGFIGHSVVGEWCNLGAGTNISNLKHSYKNIKLWGEHIAAWEETNLQFCGAFIGDHSRTGINTTINSGTIVGVSAHLFGPGFVNKFIPSFTWGIPVKKTQTCILEKALEAAEQIMQRRNVTFTPQDRKILSHIFRTTAIQRV